jgi:hypothetical protein
LIFGALSAIYAIANLQAIDNARFCIFHNTQYATTGDIRRLANGGAGRQSGQPTDYTDRPSSARIGVTPTHFPPQKKSLRGALWAAWNYAGIFQVFGF